MLALFLTLSLSADPIPGYKTISVNDAAVTPARTYLNRVLPVLFPDGKATPTIETAELQVVNGYNLRLGVAIGRTIAFTTVLAIRSEADSPKLVSIVGKPAPDALASWQWHDVSEVTATKLKEIATVLHDKGGFTGEIAEVIAIRTQVVSGENWHVIFHDKAGTLWAAVLYFAPGKGERKVSYLHKAE
jgi:hypothetical protein